jgi:hypothetical protein
MLEWFIHERRSRRHRETPLRTFLARLPDEERRRVEPLCESVLDTFAVREVVAGTGLLVEGLASGHRFEVFERSASGQLAPGAAVMGRLFRLDERTWTLSAYAIPLDDPRTAEAIWHDYGALPAEKRHPPSQRDYETLLIGTISRGLDAADVEETPEREIEPRLRELLRLAELRIDLEGLRRRIAVADFPMDVFESVLEAGSFLDAEHVEETLALLQDLWNTTPRPDLDGRTPRQVRDLSPTGPLERSLISELAAALHRSGIAEHFADDVERRRAEIAAFQSEWMERPLPDRGGRTPREIVAEERARAMEKDLRPGTGPAVAKISRNAPVAPRWVGQ